jgi:hypothetical protein
MTDRLIDPDGNEWLIVPMESYSISIGRDDHGNLVVRENGELVTDPARAVELYGNFGGAIGWPIMDLADPPQGDQ